MLQQRNGLSRPSSSQSCAATRAAPPPPPSMTLVLPTHQARLPNRCWGLWMADSDSSQRTMPVGPMFLETVAWRANMALQARNSTSLQPAECVARSPDLPSNPRPRSGVWSYGWTGQALRRGATQAATEVLDRGRDKQDRRHRNAGAPEIQRAGGGGQELAENGVEELGLGRKLPLEAGSAWDRDFRLRRIKQRRWQRFSSKPELCEAASRISRRDGSNPPGRPARELPQSSPLRPTRAYPPLFVWSLF